MKDFYPKIGAKIRETRKKQELSIEELADKAELDWSFVARIERGNAVPSIMSLFKLSKALNLTLEELFKDKTPKENIILNREIQTLLEKLPNQERKRILKILKLILEI